MKKLQISFNAAVAAGNGLTINGSGNEITLIAAVEGSSDSNTFYGGTTGTEAAEAYAEALRVSNANSKSLGPLVISVSTSTVSVTFADVNVTSAFISSVGTLSVTATSTDIDNNTYDYDKKIMARSPHFYEVSPPVNGDTIDSAELHIYAYQGARYTDRPSTPTYVIRSVASVSDQTEILFNISEFAKSFFTESLATSGTEANWNPFIDIFPFYSKSGELYSLDPDFGIAYNGYGYFEDGVNPQNEGSLAQSNSHIIALDGGTSSYAISSTETVKVIEEKDGEVISVESVNNDITFSTSAILTKKFGYIGINLKDLVRDGGFGSQEYFYNSAAEEFVNQHSITGPDKIYIENIDGSIETVKVSYIKECKYNPMKLTFTNKFGALQSLWFFKNSTESMKTEQDSFRRNTLNEFGNYGSADHQYKNLYKSGKQSITLSSGFYPESHNEIFKQLMLSQDVWLQRDSEVLPVNISDSSIDFKTSINEKLIEYTVKCDFAFDTINSIN
jgi:hypothetical protein